MGRVQGRVALVTGGASGIGAACAAKLAREGARVVVTDINDNLGKQTIEEIKNAGGEGIYLHQDVTDETRWAEVVSETEKRFGALHILVSNAGICIGATSIANMTLADWRRQVAINLDGVFLSIKYSLPAMRRSGGGSIVLMSSISALRGSPILAGYCATKAGVHLFTKSIAMECAYAGDNIRVNSVHPGIIDTPIYGKFGGQLGNYQPTVEELAKAGAPLGRAGQAEEIADGVLFLASDASRYMTGTELVIDGGITAGGLRRAPQQEQR